MFFHETLYFDKFKNADLISNMEIAFQNYSPKVLKIRHFHSQIWSSFVFHGTLHFYKFEGADFEHDNSLFKINPKNTQVRHFNSKFKVFWFRKNIAFRANTYVASENIPFSSKALLILLVSAFFCKKLAFSGQNSTFTQSNSVRAVFEIF